MQLRHVFSLAAFLLLAPSARLVGETRTFDAVSLWESSQSRGLQLTDDRTALELAEGELIEDDGPAAGYSYGPNVERLTGEIAIRKELPLAHAAARRATLLIAPGGELRVAINGREAALVGPRKVGGYWQAYTFDPAALRPGTNTFVVQGTGQVWIACDEDYAAGSTTRLQHPNRSAKSRDAGQTWDDARLGAQDNLDGEYYVRLFLERHLSEGRLTTAVIDLGQLAGQGVPAALEALGPVRLALGVQQNAGDTVEFRFRRGATFVPTEEHWSPWQVLNAAQPPGPLAPEATVFGELPYDEAAGRYLQLEVRLATGDPLTSPQLISLAVTAEPQTADWTRRVRLVEADNPPVVRTSIPFEYEPLDHPSLKKLREQYRLDEVVSGARSELELIARLAVWATTQWEKRGHLGEAFPPWDALKILAPHADRTPVGGFCLQANLVLLQACASFGIPGRVVSIGPGDHLHKIRSGHETVELWSNQFAKWIYVDGDAAWYAVDEATGVPLSLRELRERQLAVWEGKPAPPLQVIALAESGYAWPDLHAWPAFVELRLVPRSNFLQRRAPLPLNQGMRGWFWTGHYVWSDDLQPDCPLYTNRVRRRGDWDWTLNRAHCVLEPTATPGAVRVHLDSETPSLDVYLASFDGAQSQPVEPTFLWKLRPGLNRLRVYPRNLAGREGIVSEIAVEYAP